MASPSKRNSDILTPEKRGPNLSNSNQRHAPPQCGDERRAKLQIKVMCGGAGINDSCIAVPCCRKPDNLKTPSSLAAGEAAPNAGAWRDTAFMRGGEYLRWDGGVVSFILRSGETAVTSFGFWAGESSGLRWCAWMGC